MTSNELANVSLSQLRHAVTLKERIAALESELARVLGTSSASGATSGRRQRGRRAAGAAARRGRRPGRRMGWHNRRTTLVAPLLRGKRRKMSAKSRARLAALARARWAKAKAAGKSTLKG